MSNRPRHNRGGPRGGSQETGLDQKMLWDNVLAANGIIAQMEHKATKLRDQIIGLEEKMAGEKKAGKVLSSDDLDALDKLYRENYKITEDEQPYIQTMQANLELLNDTKQEAERQAAASKARGSGSRMSNVEFDGPSDSPIPSPAENRQVRKVGGSRTSSLPPSRPDGTPSESSERAGRPTIVYAVGDEVAFKRKFAGKTDTGDIDWILGEVVRIIGEGKSRRYAIKDPFPDPTSTVDPNVPLRSSASQMVPIPHPDAPLGDYEVGKQVLALYPETTTFYRAEVKNMLDGGGKVQLLFEDEAAGELKVVDRRFVLDHRG